jgi:hypothetical protein
MIAQLTASLMIVGTRVKAALHHVLVLVDCHGVRTRGNQLKKERTEIGDHPEANRLRWEISTFDLSDSDILYQVKHDSIFLFN